MGSWGWAEEALPEVCCHPRDCLPETWAERGRPGLVRGAGLRAAMRGRCWHLRVELRCPLLLACEGQPFLPSLVGVGAQAVGGYFL